MVGQVRRGERVDVFVQLIVKFSFGVGVVAQEERNALSWPVDCAS